MSRKILYVLAIFLPAVLPAARADTVKLHDKPPFENVRVVGLRDNRLVFQGVSQQYLRKPLDQVAWLALDGYPALSSAEQAAARGDFASAVSEYEQLLPQIREDWLRTYVLRRLLAASQRAGSFDRTVAHYIALLDSGVAPDALPTPAPTCGPGDPDLRRAIDRLAQAEQQARTAAAAHALRILMIQLLIYEDVSETELHAALPAVGLPATRPSAAASAPAFGILPEPPPVAVVPSAPVQLPVDTFLAAAVDEALGRGDRDRASRLVRRCEPLLVSTERPRWRLLAARCAIARHECDSAAADLLALVDATRDPALAAEALYYVGRAHECLDRPAVARKVYTGLLARDALPPAIARQARQRLTELEE